IGPIFVGSDGTLYVSRGWCNQPWVAVSHDEGATWTRTQVATNGMNTTLPSQTTPPNLDDSGCGAFGVTAPGSGQSDHEAAVVADGNGHVFFMWMALDRLPYLAVSSDGGATFGAPMMVGAPGVKEAWGPVLGFDSAGHLALAYMGSTNSPGAPWGCGNSYASVTFTGYIALIDHPLDPNPLINSAPVTPPSHPLAQGNCGPDRCNNTINDFIDVKVAPDGSAWGAYVDSNNGSSELLAAHLLAPQPQTSVPEMPWSSVWLVGAALLGATGARRWRRAANRAGTVVPRKGLEPLDARSA
ncbi:MAG: sialidase family protein, partial [Candidatus Dormibacteria bacterium]